MRKFFGTFFGRITLCALMALVLLTALPGVAAYAADDAAPAAAASDESESAGGSTVKAVAAGAVITAVCVAGAISMAHTIAKANEGISRQPEAADKIRALATLHRAVVAGKRPDNRRKDGEDSPESLLSFFEGGEDGEDY